MWEREAVSQGTFSPSVDKVRKGGVGSDAEIIKPLSLCRLAGLLDLCLPSCGLGFIYPGRKHPS